MEIFLNLNVGEQLKKINKLMKQEALYNNILKNG